MVQQMIVRTVLGALSSFAGGVGSGGGASGAAAGGTAGGAAGSMHFGGGFGEQQGMRATRMHFGSGAMGDEIPIIKRKDESIFTPEQVGSLAKALRGSGGGKAQSVQVYNNVDENALIDVLNRNPNVVLNIIGRKRSSVRQILS